MTVKKLSQITPSVVAFQAGDFLVGVDSGNNDVLYEKNQIDPELAANITYYVATTGNDVTGKGTSAKPWATPEHAYNVASSFELNNFTVTIQIADGTYPGFRCFKDTSSGYIIFVSSSGNPTNVIINGNGAAACCSLVAPCNVTLRNLTITPVSGEYAGIYVFSNAPDVVVYLDGVSFGAGFSGAQILMGNGSFVQITGSWSITGNSPNAIFLDNAECEMFATTLTLIGTPNFSDTFIRAKLQSVVESAVGYVPVFVGSATGKKFIVEDGAVIQTTTNDINLFPGNVAGDINVGGQYDNIFNAGTGGLVFNAQDYGWLPDGTDHSTQALAMLSSVSAAGGGTIYFPDSTGTYRADSQLLIPNDSASPQPSQVNFRFTGAGGGQDWYSGVGNVNASVLDLRYTGTGGKISTLGLGVLVIDHLMIMDGGASNTGQFVYTTNTTLHVHDNTFVGSGNAGQDAIILGGTSTTVVAGITSPFQGYGTTINNNHFTKLNRGVFGQTYSNSVNVLNNSFQGNVGTRAIEFRAATGIPPDIITGLTIQGNTIEMDVYVYGIVGATVRNSCFIANNFNDSGSNASYVSDYRFETATGVTGVCSGNTIVKSLNGATVLSQNGDVTQLTLQTILGAQASADTTGRGNTANQFAKGIEVYGSYVAANQQTGYPGALTVIDEFGPHDHIDIGVDANIPTAKINASNTNSAGPIGIQAQPGGGQWIFVGPYCAQQQVLTAANGATNGDNVNTTSSYVRITGPSAGFSLGGFNRFLVAFSSQFTPADGQFLTIYNSTVQTMTLLNEDGATSAQYRITTKTGADVVLAGLHTATFVYDETDSRWILTSTN